MTWTGPTWLQPGGTHLLLWGNQGGYPNWILPGFWNSPLVSGALLCHFIKIYSGRIMKGFTHLFSFVLKCALVKDCTSLEDLRNLLCHFIKIDSQRIMKGFTHLFAFVLKWTSVKDCQIKSSLNREIKFIPNLWIMKIGLSHKSNHSNSDKEATNISEH